MAVEEEFSIEIPDKDADAIHSATSSPSLMLIKQPRRTFAAWNLVSFENRLDKGASAVGVLFTSLSSFTAFQHETTVIDALNEGKTWLDLRNPSMGSPYIDFPVKYS
ncbi:hypothetical protein EIK77_009264 [Talaromyces pinophilus]|nr:hypothetical protein EIK77_009264 [Talaromyces pinophilus]